MSRDSKEYAIRQQGNKLIWADTGPDPDFPNSPELKRVLLEHPGRGLYLSPGIKDVRMPLFVLAVFYAGLFALMGDKDKPANPGAIANRPHARVFQARCQLRHKHESQHGVNG